MKIAGGHALIATLVVRQTCLFTKALLTEIGIDLVKSSLSTPFVLATTEPILWFWMIYIGTIYALLYLSFVAYPIIWTGLRHWSLGHTGLAFLGIGTGNVLAIMSEPLLRRLIQSHAKDPLTGEPPPEALVSAVCIASLLCPLGTLWFAWTSWPASIPWILPILAGIPMGMGNCLVFIYACNYIATTYGTLAASALASNACFRAMLGGTLPLAGPSMVTILPGNPLNSTDL